MVVGQFLEMAEEMIVPLLARGEVVIEQRKRREIDPTREILRQCLAELDPKEARADYTRERLEAMAGFFEAVTELYDQMKALPTGTVRKLLKMGTKVRRKAS